MNNAISVVVFYRLMAIRGDVSFQVGSGVVQVLVVLEGFLCLTLTVLMGFLWRLIGFLIAGMLYVDLYTFIRFYHISLGRKSQRTFIPRILFTEDFKPSHHFEVVKRVSV